MCRLSDLDALQDFLAAASAELAWLNDKEQIEISRDWADKNLDLPGIHRYYEVSGNVNSRKTIRPLCRSSNILKCVFESETLEMAKK